MNFGPLSSRRPQRNTLQTRTNNSALLLQQAEKKIEEHFKAQSNQTMNLENINNWIYAKTTTKVNLYDSLDSNNVSNYIIPSNQHVRLYFPMLDANGTTRMKASVLDPDLNLYHGFVSLFDKNFVGNFTDFSV